VLRESPPAKDRFPVSTEIFKKDVLKEASHTGEVAALDVIAKELHRLGVASSLAKLQEQVDEVQRGIRTEVTLPKKVMANHPLYEASGGKDTFTLEELGELQKYLDATSVRVWAKDKIGLPVQSRAQAIRDTEPTAVDVIESYLSSATGVSGILKGVKFLFFGGDADSALRNMPHHTRQAINAGVREVDQALGETIRLVAEDDRTRLFQFLGGQRVQFRRSGRQALSAGHDAMGSLSARLLNMFKGLDALDQADLLEVVEAVGSPAQASRRSLTMEMLRTNHSELVDEVDALIENMTTPHTTNMNFLADMIRATLLRKPGQIQPLTRIQLIETLMYTSGFSKRNGRHFSGTSAQRAQQLVEDIEEIFGDADPAMRTAILIGGYGYVDKAKQTWAGLGVGISAADWNAYTDWSMGFNVSAAQMKGVERVLKKFGWNAKFAEDTMLETDFYIPESARIKINQSLARGIGDVKKAGGFGFDERNLPMLFNTMYRFLKTQMIRGNFMLKQRYFVMNTIDHFVQMSMTAGFQAGFRSTTRMALQTVMAHPYINALAYAIERGTGRNFMASEHGRNLLSATGDTLARAVGAFLPGCKYHIGVNKVLEGKTEYLRLGSKVYNVADLRRIAVEEGIFSSFDTAALETAIKRHSDVSQRGLTNVMEDRLGRKLGGTAARTARLVRNEISDYMTHISDTAEAWSERERLGAMLTMMETGMSPRSAARITIDALYDYAGSMNKVDRFWLVNMIMPFWAFQKNATRQVFNRLLTPTGAYRMNQVRRAMEGSTELLSYAIYANITDPYGVDYANLTEDEKAEYDSFRMMLEFGLSGSGRTLDDLDQFERETLRGIMEVDSLDQLTTEERTLIENGYGSPDKVPAGKRLAVKMILRGGGYRYLQDGRSFELSAYLVRQDIRKGLNLESMRVSEGRGVPPRPDPSARRWFLSSRLGVSVPYPMKEEVRKYYSALAQDPENYIEGVGNAPYVEILLPESTIQAGMKHIAGLSMSSWLLGNAIKDNAWDMMRGVPGATQQSKDIHARGDMKDADARIEELDEKIAALDQEHSVLFLEAEPDLERADEIIKEIQALEDQKHQSVEDWSIAAGDPFAEAPFNIYDWKAPLRYAVDPDRVPILELYNDLLSENPEDLTRGERIHPEVAARLNQAMPGIANEFAGVEDPYRPGEYLEKPRYYIMPGPAKWLFRATPFLPEYNRYKLQLEPTALEEAARRDESWEAELTRIAREYLSLETVETNRQVTVEKETYSLPAEGEMKLERSRAKKADDE
jgi:hypothetical protein